MIHRCKTPIEQQVDTMVVEHVKRFSFLLGNVETWRETFDSSYPTIVSLADGMCYFIDTPFEQFESVMESFYKKVPLTRLN